MMILIKKENDLKFYFLDLTFLLIQKQKILKGVFQNLIFIKVILFLELFDQEHYPNQY